MTLTLRPFPALVVALALAGCGQTIQLPDPLGLGGKKPPAAAPGAPPPPQAPQMPGMPQAPQAPQMPGMPQMPQAPQMPGMPQMPQMPGMPQMPQAPQMPQMQGMPQMPGQAPQAGALPPGTVAAGGAAAAAVPAAAAPAPLAEAVNRAAGALVAGLPAAGAAPRPLVIDPVVDGATGMESAATRTLAQRVTEALRKQRADLQVVPLSVGVVQRKPLVLVGTFTPINQGGARFPKDAIRICLALADLGTGRVVARGVSLAAIDDGVDLTPTPFYQDSPTWLSEALTEAYVRTCEGTNVGDPIHPVYLQGVQAAAQIYEGTSAYDAGQFKPAADAYRRALALPQGEQLRTLNGLYLAQVKLGDMAGATETFGRIVAFGLAQKRIAVKFLFRPGAAAFVAEPALSGAYPMWIEQMARQTAKGNTCLDVVGHTSRTGEEPANERLSLQRAEAVRARLAGVVPGLRDKTIAEGVGSRQTLVGLGTDDLRDALDRRVVFIARGC